MNLPKLSPRLKKIAELVPKCETFLDIGTDHAYLPVYLINSGICKRAIASDLREGPLMRAKETAQLFGAEEKTDLRLGSGFETSERGEADAAVIAGMGGILIAELLKNSEMTAKSVKTLILQPMTAVFELRIFLYENGYTIEKEVLVSEEEKLYHIMKVTPKKEKREKSDFDLFMGDKIEKGGVLFEEYKNKQIKKLETKLSGMKKSKHADDKVKEEIKKTELLLDKIKEI